MVEMVDMAVTPEEYEEEAEKGNLSKNQIASYPYGLCICLTGDELEKLGLDASCEVGDLIHIMAMAKVTSVSKREMADGSSDNRVELQITEMGIEDENTEAVETLGRANLKNLMAKLYKS